MRTQTGVRESSQITTALFPPHRQEAVGIAVVTYEWEGTPYDFEVNREFCLSRGIISLMLFCQAINMLQREK